MNKIDWSPENDDFLKPKEIQIHNLHHANTAAQNLTPADILNPSREFRIKSLEYALKQIKKSKLTGTILEVGAGDGWCSAYILNNHKPDEIHIMEINDSATDILIPKVLNVMECDITKATVIKGSYNNIPVEDKYDYVIAMGALHHSENLLQTLKQIFKALKPEGFLIAQEPYMNDHTQNVFYLNRNNEVENFKGLLKVKNDERSDIFYRECEYKTAAFHAGFNFDYSEARKSGHSRKKSVRQFIRKILGKQSTSMVKNMVIHAQKPENKVEYPTPTSWDI